MWSWQLASFRCRHNHHINSMLNSDAAGISIRLHGGCSFQCAAFMSVPNMDSNPNPTAVFVCTLHSWNSGSDLGHLTPPTPSRAMGCENRQEVIFHCHLCQWYGNVGLSLMEGVTRLCLRRSLLLLQSSQWMYACYQAWIAEAFTFNIWPPVDVHSQMKKSWRGWDYNE